MNELEKLLRAPDGVDEVNAFYGWNASKYMLANAKPSGEWERDMLRNAQLPEPLDYIGSPVYTIHVHRKLLDRFEHTYGEIHKAGLWHVVKPFAGAYCFRLVRGGETLSLHSFGAAVDHDVAHNPLGAHPSVCSFGNTAEGQAVVWIFERNGFFWGGKFRNRKDCQHFQFATNA
jgi:hypothetical protein